MAADHPGRSGTSRSTSSTTSTNSSSPAARYAALYEHRYEEAVDAHAGDPAAAVSAFFDVVLDRIADLGVPDGCLVVQSAAQLPTLSPESREAVSRAVTARRRRVRRALDAASADLRSLATAGVQAVTPR